MTNRHNLRRAAARRASRTPSSPDAAERIAALTGMARGSWIALLSYLAFIGVTLLGVQDADFFLVERETALPLIGVTIPTSLFFYTAPALGAMLYVQLHLYLVRLWKALDDLPEGTDPKAERIRPWIVSDMALTRRPGAVHAYPLRGLSNLVVWLFTFAAGPIVLAGFWWRSTPKHDEALTILACGLPLFAVIYAGAESWRSLRVGGSRPRHVGWPARAAWGAGLLALSIAGFLTTEGPVAPSLFLRPAQLQGIVFIETPPDWLPRDEAEQVFRQEWCADRGIPKLACGSGPLVRDEDGDRLQPNPDLIFPRTTWCAEELGKTAEDCTAYFAALDPIYRDAWAKSRRDALASLPARNLSGIDLRRANLSGARMEGADLRGARMEGADLILARMEGADLGEARMEGADLSEARMKGANLSWARMEGADLSEARMEEADLSWARFSEATSFRATSLRSAALKGVDLSMLTLTQEQIDATFGDASVTPLPDGLARPPHWPVWDLPFLDDHNFYSEWRKWQADPDGYVPQPPP